MFYESFKRRIQPLINIYHFFLAVIANICYGFPSKKLILIGITGTDGKTTTAHLIYNVLRNYSHKASMVSSLGAYISGNEIKTGFHVTTPNSFKLQKLLRTAVKNKEKYFILESTSHGLDQYRLWGIFFEVSVITNITKEHLDYHKTYTNYLQAKAKLFLNSKKAILNKDDDSFDQLSEYLKKVNKKYLTYSLIKKSDFNFNTKRKLNIELSDFSNHNFLAAYSILDSLKIPKETIYKYFSNFQFPEGRFEEIYDKNFKIIVDFAHTPNSLDKILSEIAKEKQNKLIHIFGSAGLRDSEKRYAMGAKSSKYSDLIILTEEDSRIEDTEKICNEIASGFNNKFKYVKKKQLNKNSFFCYTKITNRKEAIKKAISIAQKGDVLILTGKGHERSIARGKIEYPWNEKEIILKILKK
ncbi:MAG: UDP-N-acetylmuramoyl-L-alanyl-D-glutamate--2,6-diaminopimelate ligase [bacterium]